MFEALPGKRVLSIHSPRAIIVGICPSGILLSFHHKYRPYRNGMGRCTLEITTINLDMVAILHITNVSPEIYNKQKHKNVIKIEKEICIYIDKINVVKGKF